MPSSASDPHRRLIDIRDNIRLANGFVEGLTYEAFRDNMLVFYGVTRCLEIISEASKHLPAGLKERHSQIHWSAIAGAGNVYCHDYEAVEQLLIWGTVHERLPELLAVVEQELAGSSE
ncbi:MAG: DUF86 domain-containing protein [Methylocystis sp.]